MNNFWLEIVEFGGVMKVGRLVVYVWNNEWRYIWRFGGRSLRMGEVCV